MIHDAILTNWSFYNGRLSGRIYDDSAKRFENGTPVKTSPLKSIITLSNGLRIAETLNTKYLLT